MNYGIRDGYQHREQPDYFHDVHSDGKIWQGEVYRIAAHVARVRNMDTLVDIGCGRGHKLLAYADEFKLCGVDYGENITYCRRHAPNHYWMNADLEAPCTWVRALAGKSKMVICADVIEHLQDPENLRSLLAGMVSRGSVVAFSTPDRLRTYGYDRLEEPTNPHHTREWALAEMLRWLRIPVSWAGWCRSNNVDTYKHTMLMLLGQVDHAALLLDGFEVECAL